ncbi:hypothetical protein ESCO_004004 [Escovopsis weberi]|uniref:CoA-binding domain-containing protein n=1 Tax=Escovopsis weberi TaxID=150374 RepID=A0A0M8N483_ESCWE|nr:hypothetical protein ESCO_004004 [Escovopsis weberi]
MATDAAAQRFFSSPNFAVAGASSNPAKFGHKVFAWYLERGLNATPLNPASATISVHGNEYPTLPDVKSLSSPKDTSLSIITPPLVTIGVILEARSVGIPSIWLQPGTYNDEVLRLALEEGAFDAVLYGDGGMGAEGWCVLVDGDKARKAAGKL